MTLAASRSAFSCSSVREKLYRWSRKRRKGERKGEKKKRERREGRKREGRKREGRNRERKIWLLLLLG